MLNINWVQINNETFGPLEPNNEQFWKYVEIAKAINSDPNDTIASKKEQDHSSWSSQTRAQSLNHHPGHSPGTFQFEYQKDAWGLVKDILEKVILLMV